MSFLGQERLGIRRRLVRVIRPFFPVEVYIGILLISVVLVIPIFLTEALQGRPCLQ